MNSEFYQKLLVPKTYPGRGRCAPRRQSLLRSYLAAHSFPRRPPAYVLSAVGTRVTPRRLMPKRLTRRVDHYLGSEKVQTGRSPIMRAVGAGGGGVRGEVARG